MLVFGKLFIIRNCFYCLLCLILYSHISAKDYESALEAFITCVTTPSNMLSQVIIQALKKAKLVSLLHNGEKFFLPK